MIHKNTQSRCQHFQKQVIRKSLHVFTDALRNAFRVIVYQRCVYNTKKLSCRLIIAKSNVAPLKTTSTPLLELQGVVLRLKLISKVVQTFKEEIESIIFCTVTWIYCSEYGVRERTLSICGWLHQRIQSATSSH